MDPLRVQKNFGYTLDSLSGKKYITYNDLYFRIKNGDIIMTRLDGFRILFISKYLF